MWHFVKMTKWFITLLYSGTRCVLRLQCSQPWRIQGIGSKIICFIFVIWYTNNSDRFSSYSSISPFHVLWCQNLMLHGTGCVRNDLQFHLFSTSICSADQYLGKWKNVNPKDFQPYFILENVKMERFSVETLFISLQPCLLWTLNHKHSSAFLGHTPTS